MKCRRCLTYCEIVGIWYNPDGTPAAISFLCRNPDCRDDWALPWAETTQDQREAATNAELARRYQLGMATA